MSCDMKNHQVHVCLQICLALYCSSPMAVFSRTSHSSLMAVLVLLLGLFMTCFYTTDAQSIGVCYGMQGNNLPPPSSVISLYQSNGINRMRLYDPNQDALNALRGSNIEVTLGVPNSNIQSFASDSSSAYAWVLNNVQNFPNVNFRWIAVGNEVDPIYDVGTAQNVLLAMSHVWDAVASAGLSNQIRVSTAIAFNLLGNSYPPSQSYFNANVRWYIDPIVNFLRNINAPLLVNIYPYFAYSDNPGSISLDYALFTSPSVVVQDGQYGYQNLFDAMLDAMYAALQPIDGGSALTVVVSESGWPSDGGFATSVGNAQTYYSNLIPHVRRGTPRRPNVYIETYLFAMFDENQKPAGLEQHWGLFFPNGQPKYSLNFAAGSIRDVPSINDTSVDLKSDM